MKTAHSVVIVVTAVVVVDSAEIAAEQVVVAPVNVVLAVVAAAQALVVMALVARHVAMAREVPCVGIVVRVLEDRVVLVIGTATAKVEITGRNASGCPFRRTFR